MTFAGMIAGPPDRLLDLRRVDSVPGNVADVVQIPIEAFNAPSSTT
jgi:hypothetical protein